MGTLDKLKAYFGMVPADDELDDYRAEDRYDPADEDYRRPGRGYRPAPVRDEHYEDDYPEPVMRRPRRRPARPVEDLDEMEIPVRGRVRPVPADPLPASGSLAMDRAAEPVSRLRQVDPAPASRDPLSKIVTLHPTNYAEARLVGEAFRDGNPVIMNLTEMDNADAKRLVDFAAGLAFALRGSIDKVTNKVFLLSPPDADVSAEDRRRIAEDGLFLRR